MTFVAVLIVFFPIILLAIDGVVVSLDIDIAVLSYSNFESLPTLANLRPAVETGVESLRRVDSSFNVSLSYVTGAVPSCIEMGTKLEQTLAAWYYWKVRGPRTVRAIVSSGCSDVEAMNQLAANWNVLLITTVHRLVSTSSFTDTTRRTFPTYLTTTYMSSAEDNYKELFLRLNWTLLYVIADTRSPDILPIYGSWSQGIVQALRRDSRFSVYATMKTSFSSSEPLNIKAELLRFRLISRILVLFGNPRQLRVLLKEAAALNMTNGEYAFIILKPFKHLYYNNFVWKNGDADDETIRHAYKAVLLVYVGEIDNATQAAIDHLTPKWRESFIRSNNVNSTRTDATRDLVSQYLISTHQAFQLIGQALNERLNGSREIEVSDLPSGRNLASMLVNRTIDLDTGLVVIDEFGRRVPSFAFRYFDPQVDDFKVDDFKTFMISKRRKGRLTWEDIRQPVWFGSSILPADRPACGFQDENPTCHPAENTKVFIISVTTVLLLLLLSVGMSGWFLLRWQSQQKLQTSWWTLPADLLRASAESKNSAHVFRSQYDHVVQY